METEANKSQKSFFSEIVDETIESLSRIWNAPKRSDINFIFKIISLLRDRNLKKFDKFFPILFRLTIIGLQNLLKIRLFGMSFVRQSALT